MSIITLIGIDPGLVDTGAVCLTMNTDARTWAVEAAALAGGETDAVLEFVAEHGSLFARLYVEKYRERGTAFRENGPMRKFEADLRSAMPIGTKFLENMGVKRVVSDRMLRMFDLFDVKTTNHRDIQAAARIMLLGAVKDEQLNEVIYQFITDHIDDNPWIRVGDAIAA